MIVDRNGLEILQRPECLRLLETASVGRVGLSIGALPVVLPVNFALLGEDIVVRSGPGTKLDAAFGGAVVAFEVDRIDEKGEAVWSVLVQGLAHVIAGANELARARALDLRPWVGGPDDRFVKISTDRVSGRRIPPGRREAEGLASIAAPVVR